MPLGDERVVEEVHRGGNVQHVREPWVEAHGDVCACKVCHRGIDGGFERVDACCAQCLCFWLARREEGRHVLGGGHVQHASRTGWQWYLGSMEFQVLLQGDLQGILWRLLRYLGSVESRADLVLEDRTLCRTVGTKTLAEEYLIDEHTCRGMGQLCGAAGGVWLCGGCIPVVQRF